MSRDNREPHRFRVRLLFGLFEADATGTIAIGAAVVMFVLFGAGRLWTLW